jgi:hypothetical protein
MKAVIDIAKLLNFIMGVEMKYILNGGGQKAQQLADYCYRKDCAEITVMSDEKYYEKYSNLNDANDYTGRISDDNLRGVVQDMLEWTGGRLFWVEYKGVKMEVDKLPYMRLIKVKNDNGGYDFHLSDSENDNSRFKKHKQNEIVKALESAGCDCVFQNKKGQVIMQLLNGSQKILDKNLDWCDFM